MRRKSLITLPEGVEPGGLLTIAEEVSKRRFKFTPESFGRVMDGPDASFMESFISYPVPRVHGTGAGRI